MVGMVQVYTGDGKGKTTAALGLALRAAGHGLRVYIGQFMKGVRYGELAALANVPNIQIKQFGRPQWVDPQGVTDEDIAMAQQALKDGTDALQSGGYDIVILDEINVAAAWGLLAVEQVVELIRSRPSNVELVLTGRCAPSQVLESADLITEMREIKHPYHKGVISRQGIEF